MLVWILKQTTMFWLQCRVKVLAQWVWNVRMRFSYSSFKTLVTHRNLAHWVRHILIKLLQFSFNALLAILEPQRRPSILDFGVHFYGGSELSKKTFKMIATDAKNAENRTRSEFFLWRTKFWEAFCKRDWHNMRSYLFFNMQKLVTKITNSYRTFIYTFQGKQATKDVLTDRIKVLNEWHTYTFTGYRNNYDTGAYNI